MGVNLMKLIKDQTFDEERALYGSDNIALEHCIFDGPADGESALKECRNVQVEHCFFNLRYPFWHDETLKISDSEMSEFCRAALWYSADIIITNSRLHGIKTLRECERIELRSCDVISPEFGWSVHDMVMEDSTVQSEYFMMRSGHLTFRDVSLQGKYSFQYIYDSVFEDCQFDTKDAFWHAKDVLVRNCVVKGEYLAWYCENVTFDHCKIIGTQPFCYCKGLRLVDCEMIDTDLCFEKSEVEATVITSIESIKNPRSGHIYVPCVGEVIRDDDLAEGRVIVGEEL